MSSTIIVSLVIGAIVILLLVGYLNNALEKSKLEKARRKADLIDRQRRCSSLSETLPGQLMSVELKQLLNRIELKLNDELLAVDANNTACQARAAQLREWATQGEALAVNNTVLTITSDAQIKDVRFQLESLQTQIKRAAEDKVISNAEAKQWLAEVRRMLVSVYIDYFQRTGQELLAQQRTQQARLVFERAVQFLQKQKDPAPYKASLDEFKALLTQASALSAAQTQAAATQSNELTAAVEQENEDDTQWQKKQMYD
ncbi:MAG: hypothetical protein GX908_01170 [Gammaproteobacteria bacterium]|nr:hypothetical protein [Gammaproteobacteria bacterium]